ncbi:MAG TPA: urease accessory protein UreD [Kofleriaceae bacterium]|nr:urease accessory protein UreD [Kofleriaceae bacterium]
MAEPGRGVLEVVRVGAASIVRRASGESPLKLVTTRNHGDAAWVFMASFGGGLVDGDRVTLDVQIGQGATAYLTTQASTKVYRRAGDSERVCLQQLTAEVAAGGLLVLLPDPVVCFAGASYRQEVTVRLARGASLLLFDGLTAGRSARGERWQFAAYRSATTVFLDGERLVADALELDPRHGPLPERMGRWEAIGTLLAVGPRAAPLVCAPAIAVRTGALLAAPSPLPAPPGVMVEGVKGAQAAEGTLVRLAGASAEVLHTQLRAQLPDLARALGDDPFARKW